MRRWLAFPPSRRGQCKPSFSYDQKTESGGSPWPREASGGGSLSRHCKTKRSCLPPWVVTLPRCPRAPIRLNEPAGHEQIMYTCRRAPAKAGCAKLSDSGVEAPAPLVRRVIGRRVAAVRATDGGGSSSRLHRCYRNLRWATCNSVGRVDQPFQRCWFGTSSHRSHGRGGCRSTTAMRHAGPTPTDSQPRYPVWAELQTV